MLLDEPLLVDPPVGFAHRYRARDTWPLTLIPVTVRGPVRSLPLPTPAPAPAAPPRPLSSLTFNYVKTTHRVVSDSPLSYGVTVSVLLQYADTIEHCAGIRVVLGINKTTSQCHDRVVSIVLCQACQTCHH